MAEYYGMPDGVDLEIQFTDGSSEEYRDISGFGVAGDRVEFYIPAEKGEVQIIINYALVKQIKKTAYLE